MAFLFPRSQQHQTLGMQRVKSSAKLQTPQDDIDEFLSSDLDLSMSLNSPGHSAAQLPEEHDPMAMDISPAKPIVRAECFTRPSMTRPRAFTNDPRLFGRDLSNNTNNVMHNSHASLEVPGDPTRTLSSNLAKKMARPGLPMQWTSYAPPSKDDNVCTLGIYDCPPLTMLPVCASVPRI